MEKYIKIISIAVLFYMNNSSVTIANAEITPEMKANSETAIKSCEQIYQNTKNLGARFDNVKKPGFLSSGKAKDAYVNKMAFEQNMAQFTQFTNDKIKIRTAKTLPELRDQVAAYSSNCARFAAGLAGFVEWATTGHGPAGFDKTYKWWQDEARKQMKK